MINKEFFVTSATTVKSALKQLDMTAKKTLLVVTDDGEFRGTLSDGDIRRFILKGESIDQSIDSIFNTSSFFLEDDDPQLIDKARDIFLKQRFELIPVLSSDRRVVKCLGWDDVFSQPVHEITSKDKLDLPVVIMAGGKGTRMAPFTHVLPKPLIPVGEKTILEYIIAEFHQFGITDYHLTLNFRGEMIEAYFKSIEKNYSVNFVWEEEFFGTAGSLKLLSETINGTFIVSNCDVMVKTDYSEVFKFHKENGAALTMLSSIQHYRIPYGVVEYSNGGRIEKILEKPEHTININTGIYMLDSKVLNFIPENKVYNMTDLMDDLIKNNEIVLMYPVNESDYIDIGQWDEYRKALSMLKIFDTDG